MSIDTSAEFSKFRTILSELLCPENNIRSEAERSYGDIPCNKKVGFLLSVLGCEGIPLEEAELSATLLRRLFTYDFKGMFTELSAEEQAQIKNQLLHLIQQNINHNLRKKISDAAAELAKNYIDDDGNNHWPEFLKFLYDSACSFDPVLKELALLMFASVPGIFGNQQSTYIGVIHQMLVQSLSDQQPTEVKYAAVKATSSFMLAHERESIVQKQFSDCLNLLLQFFSQAMDSNNECTEDILRYLVDLVDPCAQSFRSQFDLLFELCLKCITTCSMEASRHLAVEVIITLAESAPGMVRKLGIKHLPAFVNALFKMMTDLDDDPEWDFDDENTEEENDSNNIVGEAALDRLACALGGKTVLPIILSSLSLMLNSAEWKNRCAGLMTVSAVGEGCHKHMSAILPQIVEGVLPFLMDPHSRVRHAACNALGQMSTDFAPGFQKKFHDKVINGLLQLLADTSSPRVQAHAGAALVNFFEDCPKHILSPYMNNIADSLESVLSSKLNELVEKGTKLVLEQLVITLASLADCAQEKFVYYYDKFMPFLKFIIQNAHQPQLRLLRGKTIECISLIGLAVGKEKFLTDASDVMDLLLKSQTNTDSLSEDDPQLTYMIAAWARICKILGKGFEPYLPYVMQPVLKAAALKPEIAILAPEDIEVIENDEDWEFVNLGGKRNYGIRTAGLDEKATACQMLVCYAKELKEGFAPYVEETLQLMIPMLKFYFHDGVRAAAAEIFPYLLESAKVKGDAYVQEMWRYILQPFLQALESEPELEVICDEMAAFSQCIEVMDSKCFQHDDLMGLMELLKKKLLDHFVRSKDRELKRNEEDYDDVLEETLEKEDGDDVYILSKISDIICTLFATYKQDFFPYFDVLLPQYLDLLGPNRSVSDRQWSLCVFADVIVHGGPACAKYQQYFLQSIIESLSDENPDLRQTAAYAIGCLGSCGGPEFSKVCAETIPLLIGMINGPESRSEDNIKATENAISAITKFVSSNNTFVNSEEIIPLLLTWLPIWEDDEEAKFVYNFLCFLLETNNTLLLGEENCNIPRIVQIFSEAFHKEAVEPTSDVGKRIIMLIQEIRRNEEIFSVCVNILAPHQQEALHSALFP